MTTFDERKIGVFFSSGSGKIEEPGFKSENPGSAPEHPGLPTYVKYMKNDLFLVPKMPPARPGLQNGQKRPQVTIFDDKKNEVFF